LLIYFLAAGRYLARQLDLTQLRYPSFDVFALSIIIKCLLDRVEDASLTWIVAYACNVLPISPIAGDVIVNKEGFVPLCADTPVDVEM